VLSARVRGLFTSRYRRALTRTAVSAVAAGLPVVPGAWWSPGSRSFECDLAGCSRTGPHPAVRNDNSTGQPGAVPGLAAHAVRQPAAVVTRWNHRPYAVLVPTGESCDVVDVPAALGPGLAVRLDARSALGPVIAAGARWFFLTAPGGQLPVLGGDVLMHGQGSWIVLPPSLGPGGAAATWLVRPAAEDWDLPTRDDVVAALPPAQTPSVPAPRSISLVGKPTPAGRQASPAPA
jgi:hypothetical protein